MHVKKPFAAAAILPFAFNLCPVREHRDPYWNPDGPHSESHEPMAPVGGFTMSVNSMTTTGNVTVALTGVQAKGFVGTVGTIIDLG